MNTRLFVAAALVVVGGIWSPRTAEACGCGGTTPSPVAFRHSAAVFVGRVNAVKTPPPPTGTNPDGSVWGSVTPAGPSIVTFEIRRVFRGSIREQAVLNAGHTTCDFLFRPSEIWLIYALEEDGVLSTHKCLRTRLVSEAPEDLRYLDGLLEGRPQALLSGNVFERTITPDGAPAPGALFETLDVVATGGGQRFRTKTDRWGPYQLVLPPGEFEVWVERGGRRVTPTSTIRVRNGDEQTLAFTAELQ
jgi:hypothetical protein